MAGSLIRSSKFCLSEQKIAHPCSRLLHEVALSWVLAKDKVSWVKGNPP